MVENRAKIVYIGNPLLDISHVDPEKKYMEKYGLALGQACLATPEQMPIYDELFKEEGRDVLPGGSALNSARASQHVLKCAGTDHKVAYMGCLGKDSYAETLKQSLHDCGVDGKFAESDEPTGTCAVVVVGKERTLCANIGASCKFPMEHLETNMEHLEHADYVYSTGFFITSNFDALVKAGSFCAEQGKPFGFNLSAEFLIMFSLEQVLKAISLADYVFCNEDEQRCIKEKLEVDDINMHIAKMKKEGADKKPKRVVISTQGAAPTQVCIHDHASGETEVFTQEVPALEKDLIVDTNGAGDSFVGGFFSAFVLGKDLKGAIDMGNKLAGVVVQNSGCMFKGYE